MIRHELWWLYRMRDGVLHCIVVDPVAVSPFDTLCSMFCQPVDSGGWWKWWFRGSWVGWVFAFDGYTELPEAGSDGSLAIE
ncbi:hypothetical protein [Mycobacterium marinum]|uniref:hypothetical protein n=1 Tax=Mycobacterium marinum TaxID=1781 RepID=UPI003562B6C8